jgi:hypothetical protein
MSTKLTELHRIHRQGCSIPNCLDILPSDHLIWAQGNPDEIDEEWVNAPDSAFDFGIE